MAETRSGVARLALSFAATACLAVAAVVVSESWFWARLRPGDSVLGFASTSVAYGLAVQVVRYVAHRRRVSAKGPGAWRRILLLGALYGWLVEGVIVTTVIDDMPFTLSWTGLAWHALFTVLVGWWWIPRTLDRPARGSVWRLGAVGASVGVTTLAYAAGLAGWWALRGRAAPRLLGSLTAMVLLAALAALAVLNAIANPLTLIGPALVGLALVALITTAPHLESAPTDAAPEPLARRNRSEFATAPQPET